MIFSIAYIRQRAASAFAAARLDGTAPVNPFIDGSTESLLWDLELQRLRQAARDKRCALLAA